jgi:isoleucyl-tRNA synthetase
MSEEKVDYSKTVLLPETGFPMRASLPATEPLRLKAWEAADLYGRLRRERAAAPRWVLHDGPPFANGDIHMGTALNKVLKDVAIRYRTLRGFDAPYVPGWDTHGMPIEFKVSRELKGKPVTPLELRRLCRAEAEKWVQRQREQFKRLGGWGDWEHPYITMDPAFEAGQLDAYWALLKRKQVYRDVKPVHWSWATQTALAEAELEYKEKTSTQVFVKYRLDAESSKALGAPKPAFAVIWTTTPWTLPASLAITVNERFDYALYDVGGECWLLGTALASGVLERAPEVAPLEGLERAEALSKVLDRRIWNGRGSELENLKAAHPFLERTIRFCLAPYVTADAGTGLVHTAPGHGAEDYVTGVRYKLEILCPVDEKGCYDEKVEPARFKGMRVTDPATDEAVLELLREKGALIHSARFQHSYPHDWRSKQPVIFRATKQWFMSLTANGLREEVLKEIDKVRWINPWGRERFANMMKDRADWCISRQRVWGVPIYMFYCEACGTEHFDEACYAKLKPLVAAEGGDAWFDPARPLADFLPQGARCAACGGTAFRKETDTLDVWFDSGSSSVSVLKARPGDQAFPADLYLEGSDQYRGWFQSSMLVSVGVNGSAPYRSVLSTGWTLDAQGRAMHKSAGNAIDPLKVIEQYGADVLRLWTASEDATADMTVSDALFKSVADNYRLIRNTLRWLLGALSGFEPKRDARPFAELEPFDRWLLGRLKRLIEGVTASMEAYELHKAFAQILAFCSGELSSLAFDVHKDTLYTLAASDPRRRSAQTAFHETLQALLRMVAPVLCFTADEAWGHLPEAQRSGDSVHLDRWPDAAVLPKDEELDEEFKVLLELVRPQVKRALEALRAAKTIGHSYDAEVTLSVHSKKLLRILNRHADFLPQLLIVSAVRLGAAAPQDGLALGPEEIKVGPSGAHKCGRCWRHQDDVASEGGLCGRCAAALGGHA